MVTPLWRIALVMKCALVVTAVSAAITTRTAHAGGCIFIDTGAPVTVEACSRTTNETSRAVETAQDWCDGNNGPCAGTAHLILNQGDTTPAHEDWDAFFVPANCEYRGFVDVTLLPDVNFSQSRGSVGSWVKVRAGERFVIQQIICHAPEDPPDDGIGDAPPDSGIGVADPPAGAPQQQRQRSSIVAVGDGVDDQSVDILSAARDSNGFAAIINGRHAPGYGWHGMKVVAGDFNGDGRMDVGAIAAGVDGHSVDLLVALSNGKGGYAPIANWRHADGLGWNGMKVVAGDFNGDGRWDIGAICDGVAGGVDLLIATSTGSSFRPVANWRHAADLGWGGMKPIAGDFNGDGKWDVGAIGAGVDNHSVDLLVATSTGSGFNAIANWRHADGFGWNGMKPVAGDFNGDGKWDIGAVGAGVDGHSVDLLVATSTGLGFNAIANWRHADGFGWNGMKPVAGDFNGDGKWDIGAIGDGVDGQSVDLLVALSGSGGFSAIANWLHAGGYGWHGMSPSSL